MGRWIVRRPTAGGGWLMSGTRATDLQRLAQRYGVLTAYEDAFGQRRSTTAGALLATLRALRCPVARPADVRAALVADERQYWQRLIEPVLVAWDGKPVRAELRVPARWGAAAVACRLQYEHGQILDWEVPLARVAARRGDVVDGTKYVCKRLVLDRPLPSGYHRLRVTVGGSAAEATIISAPHRAYAMGGRDDGKSWGVFLPLYALTTRRSWGTADFTDLQALAQWAGSMGARAVGTLPLLATFLDECFEPSPYVPVSRRFWNELYLDVSRVPEVQRCPAVRQAMGSSAFQRELRALREGELVDYRRSMRQKRQLLERLAACLFSSSGSSARQSAYRRFLREHPMLEDYARFRATCERQRTGWPVWEPRLRDGQVREGDYEERAARYHGYVQWLAQDQLQDMARAAGRGGARLYLDLPLGVHVDGFDVWRERQVFAVEARVGAPPDPVFTAGQDWGFPPMHPAAIREEGYRYFAGCVRALLRCAGYLRVDHIMSLHRLFWVPPGYDAAHGVYVQYHAEEMYAILSLESHRARAAIVGENLGTVPPEVGHSMEQHNICRMFVLQYEIPSTREGTLREPERGTSAGLNTHDMPTFATFWQGLDIDSRLRLGLVRPREASRERRTRARMRELLVRAMQERGWLGAEACDTAAVLRACLRWLSASRASLVSVGLEDLWLEGQPQNVPSTHQEYPNWQRKARYTLEEFGSAPEVADVLRKVHQWRRARRRGR